MDNVIEMFDSFKKRFKQDSNHLISTSIKVDRNVRSCKETQINKRINQCFTNK